jgi:hypothetical protein
MTVSSLPTIWLSSAQQLVGSGDARARAIASAAAGRSCTFGT